MNRKLIRTTLAEIKSKKSGHPQRPGNGSHSKKAGGSDNSQRSGQAAAAAAAVQVRKRVPPPVETHAELFYYKKQIDSHTPMVILLQDGEEIEGTIEWYDKNALKVNRKAGPNLLLLKHNIKYMYKADERVT